MQRIESDGSISGVPISAKGFKSSHLFFADDSLLFCLANFMEWGRIQHLLHLYELDLGQNLNSDKTSIFFSKNTQREFKEHISSLVGISATTGYEMYLELPAPVGHSNNKTFTRIQGCVNKRLEGWKEKFLSQVGKEILIKTVIQAIPTYDMSVFPLPKTLCNALNSLMTRLWWGSQHNGNMVYWMSWEMMGVSKKMGGMGFRDL
jgi:hypothetical protein